MSDKELIKQEIERLKNEQLYIFSKGENEEIYGTALTCIGVYNQLLSFINSLPEESANEDLEEEIDRYYSDWQFDDDTIYEDMRNICRHFAEWQKEKHNKQFGFLNLKDCKDAYNEWKSTQDNPSAALAWVRACEWQKQKMMRDAVELHIVESFNPVGTENENPHGFTALCYNAEYPDFYQVTGQTIKVIPIETL